MIHPDVERAISEAQGYAEIGMHLEAWETIKLLPCDSCRLLPEVVAVRLLVCTGLKKWVMGADLVRLIARHHPLREREAAGRFHLAHAESLCAAGDVFGARQCVNSISILWPEGRAAALQSSFPCADLVDRAGEPAAASTGADPLAVPPSLR